MKEQTELERHLDSFRGQLRDATDKTNPGRLPQTTKAYLDGIESLTPTLADDPTLAAMAFHSRFRFDKPRIPHDIFEGGEALDEHWSALKPVMRFHQSAHAAVLILEKAGLHKVLVIAAVVNYKVDGVGPKKDDELWGDLSDEAAMADEETEVES